MSDWPAYQAQFKDPDRYFGEYAKASTNQILGDSSVYYVYSEAAIDRILEHNQDAKFILLLRNPIEMALSYHAQLVRNLQEDVLDFQEAWRLQGDRDPSRYPLAVRENLQIFEYSRICTLSPHIARWKHRVDDSHLRIELLDDLKEQPARVYRSILAFLQVPDDNRQKFEPINVRTALRSPRLARLMRDPPAPLRRLWRAAKPSLERLGIAHSLTMNLRRLNHGGPASAPISPEVYAMLAEHFEDEIGRLSEMLGRDLVHWKWPLG